MHNSTATPQLAPNFTAIPNFLLDSILPLASPAEWKVITFVCRKTYGWKKREDRISFTQMEQGTGLCRRALQGVVEKLRSYGLLLCTRSGKGNRYALNITCDVDQVVKRMGGKAKASSSEVWHSVPQTMAPSAIPAMALSSNTKETLTKETLKRKKPGARLRADAPERLLAQEFTFEQSILPTRQHLTLAEMTINLLARNLDKSPEEAAEVLGECWQEAKENIDEKVKGFEFWAKDSGWEETSTFQYCLNEAKLGEARMLEPTEEEVERVLQDKSDWLC